MFKCSMTHSFIVSINKEITCDSEKPTMKSKSKSKTSKGGLTYLTLPTFVNFFIHLR
ncbi:Uncharacterized protein APZ42_026966 [Daphnia magna]|uniref:Uncharacterized protein n=1 Tax=Daphnia magna TaxID=35525 RepID=A0A164RTN2_9CRUS|nr:Uncharacterized protein APZ42_026966 [Daphnia magna]